MFPQLKKLNNESGIVLFIVLMTAIIIMVFSLGILTQSVNEANSSQQQVDQIVSDQLSKGIFWNAYANGDLATQTHNIGVGTVMLQGRVYTMALNWYANPSGFQTWNATANYDTF
jgi:hypothetical protein